jgi:hypothetical protein
MAYETKDNTGSMFPNDRKESANHPDAKGSAMIDGVEYWVSGWNKKTQEGKGWRSLAFTRKDQDRSTPTNPNNPKYEQRAPAPSRAPSHDAAKARQLPRQGSGFDDMTDDVPF